MRARLAMGNIGPGLGERAFASLESIDNGILVHYLVPVKIRQKGEPLGFPPGTPGLEEARDRVFEYHTISSKTVYCRDLEAVEKAVRAADAARQEVERLEKDGKLDGPGYSATA